MKNLNVGLFGWPDCRWVLSLLEKKLMQALLDRAAVNQEPNPVEFWNGREIYGVFIEEHFSSSCRKLPYVSVITVRPRRRFFWIKSGVVLDGICFRRAGKIEEIRRFSSLEATAVSLTPLRVKYFFAADERGISFSDEGFISFGGMVNGAYNEASGSFVLPPGKSESRANRNERISFLWKRIPQAKIKGLLGKSTIANREDIRQFIDLGGINRSENS